MIVSFLMSILIVIMGLITSLSSFVVGDFSIWPDSLLNGLTYFFTGVMNFDFALNTSELLEALLFFITFEAIYYTVKLVIRFFNWVRGADGLDV